MVGANRSADTDRLPGALAQNGNSLMVWAHKHNERAPRRHRPHSQHHLPVPGPLRQHDTNKRLGPIHTGHGNHAKPGRLHHRTRRGRFHRRHLAELPRTVRLNRRPFPPRRRPQHQHSRLQRHQPVHRQPLHRHRPRRRPILHIQSAGAHTRNQPPRLRRRPLLQHGHLRRILGARRPALRRSRSNRQRHHPPVMARSQHRRLRRHLRHPLSQIGHNAIFDNNGNGRLHKPPDIGPGRRLHLPDPDPRPQQRRIVSVHAERTRHRAHKRNRRRSRTGHPLSADPPGRRRTF